MGAKYTLVIDAATDDVKTLRRLFDRSNKRKSLTNVQTYLGGVLGGVKRARIHANVATAQASGTVTIVWADTEADDTVVIGGVTFTAKASPASSVQFALSTTATLQAEALVAKVNAHATAQKLVAATNVAGVVTFRSIFPGPIGNLITLAKTGDGYTVSAATLANGDADEVDTYNFGYH